MPKYYVYEREMSRVVSLQGDLTLSYFCCVLGEKLDKVISYFLPVFNAENANHTSISRKCQLNWGTTMLQSKVGGIWTTPTFGSDRLPLPITKLSLAQFGLVGHPKVGPTPHPDGKVTVPSHIIPLLGQLNWDHSAS